MKTRLSIEPRSWARLPRLVPLVFLLFFGTAGIRTGLAQTETEANDDPNTANQLTTSGQRWQAWISDPGAAPSVQAGTQTVPVQLVGDPGDAVYSGIYRAAEGVAGITIVATDTNGSGLGIGQATVSF